VLQVVVNNEIVVVTKVSNISEDVTDDGNKRRPWYMSGGTRWPLPATKSPKSGRRMALLWPEEDPGSDRITNQLMFAPTFAPEGESSSQRLKKILLYYGLGSWFSLKPCRDMFRDAQCPVDTCTITMDQKQKADADAIVYHHRFAHPHHPRPPKQVRSLNLLYWQGSTESCERVVSPARFFWERVFEICYDVDVFMILYHLEGK
jgi:glycoprotein 3-alpha-L-fucosyltransferase